MKVANLERVLIKRESRLVEQQEQASCLRANLKDVIIKNCINSLELTLAMHSLSPFYSKEDINRVVDLIEGLTKEEE